MIKTIASKIKEFIPVTVTKADAAKKMSSNIFVRRSSSDIAVREPSCQLQPKSSCRCTVNMESKESNYKYNDKDEEYILTSLFFAIQYKNSEMLRELCERVKIYLNILNQDGISPLHFAAIVGANDCIKVLYEFGACSNMLDVRGQTPIYYAEMMEKLDTVECLRNLSKN